LVLIFLNRPPCNRHYLLEGGCTSPTCPYAHDYLLTLKDIERLKLDSKKSPCVNLRDGKDCFLGIEKCHMGHCCPYGRECRYGFNCRFIDIRKFLLHLVLSSPMKKQFV